MKTGIVRDWRFLDHDIGMGHVESPERLKAIYKGIDQNLKGPFVEVAPRLATEQEILLVHSQDYVRLLKSTSTRNWTVIDPDTIASEKTYEIARLAAGGTLKAVDLIMEGKLNNAFAVVRPPGHHARSDRGMGFCFINNAAVAAGYLIRHHNLKRVLLVDFDIHHGNGTEEIFYARPDVLFFSTHQLAHYPGTGAARDVGAAEGLGFNLNIPLLAGKNETDFLAIYQSILDPVARQYNPEFIIVSAGFDIGFGDPLGGMRVTTAGFGLIASFFRSLAEDCCQGKILFVLEGGYNLRVLQAGVLEVLRQLGAEKCLRPDSARLSRALWSEVKPCFEVFHRYWNLPEPVLSS